MVISRKAIACPCKAWGVIWCSMLMIIGCTVPSASPSNTEHTPIAQALGIKG